MTTFSSPESWTPPIWHPDYGNPEVEIDRLRSVAIAIRDAMPSVRFSLEIPEPGIIEVTVHMMNDVTAKLLSATTSNECSESRYAIFIHPDSHDEIEQYFYNINEIVAFMRNFGS